MTVGEVVGLPVGVLVGLLVGLLVAVTVGDRVAEAATCMTLEVVGGVVIAGIAALVGAGETGA